MRSFLRYLILALGDSLLVVGGLAAGSVLVGSDGFANSFPPLWSTLVVLVVFLFSLYLGDLSHTLSPPYHRSKLFARSVLAIGGAGAATGVFSQFMPSAGLGPMRLMILSSFMVASAYLWRKAFSRVFYWLAQPVRVVIVSAGGAGMTIGAVLAAQPEFDLLGYVDDDPDKRKQTGNGFPILGAKSDLVEVVERYRPSLVVLAIDREDRELFRRLLQCKTNGIDLYDMPSLYEELVDKVPVNHVNDSWFVYTSLRGIGRTFYAMKIKRVLDLVLSTIGLLLALPLCILTVLAIAAESGFPVMYRQKRVGQNEEEYLLIKFRSMRHGAEEGTGAVWARPGDIRVTRVGRIIRLLRIDEIPQMWNVLKGEMSFIGPRPERPEFVKELKKTIPYYALRHTIKPGIAGWAQVNYPYGASEKDALEKLQYDLYYLKNMSLLLDLHILIRTMLVVVLRQGSR